MIFFINFSKLIFRGKFYKFYMFSAFAALTENKI